MLNSYSCSLFTDCIGNFLTAHGMEINLSVAPSTFCSALIYGLLPKCGIVQVLCLAINVLTVTVLSVGSMRLDFISTAN